MKIESIRVIVVYADVIGFLTWSRRVSPQLVLDFFSETYPLYRNWGNQNKYWLKMQGDGFIAINELPKERNRNDIIKFLRGIWRIQRGIETYLKTVPYPRPLGFRVRAVMGDCWKITEKDGSIDYVGYPMGFARRLLDVAKDEERFLICEGVFDELGRRGDANLSVRKVNVGDLHLRGIHEEDQRNFWSFKFNN